MITQFKVSQFRSRWWWFLYTRDTNGLETVTRQGNCRGEKVALLRGMIAWAKHNMARRG